MSGFLTDLVDGVFGSDKTADPQRMDIAPWLSKMDTAATNVQNAGAAGRDFAQNFYNQSQPQIGQYQGAVLGDVNRLGGLASQVVGLGDQSAGLVRDYANPAYVRESLGLEGYAKDPWALARGEQLAGAAGALTSKNRGMAMRESGRRMVDPNRMSASLAQGAQQGVADEVGGYNTGYMGGLNEQYGRDQLTWQQRPQDWMQAYGLGGNMVGQGAGLRGNALNAGLPFAGMGLEGYKMPITAGQAVGGIYGQGLGGIGQYNSNMTQQYGVDRSMEGGALGTLMGLAKTGAQVYGAYNQPGAK